MSHALPTTPTASDAAERRALLALAGPLVGANLLQMAVFAVDVVFVARLGTVEFAASTLGVFLFNLLSFAVIGMAGAAEPLIAAAIGRRNHAVREVRRAFRMAIWLALIASLPVMLALLYGETLLRLAGQDAQVAARAGAFLDILAIAVIPAVTAGLMRVTAAALGRPRWAFAVTALALAVSIVANWALVFGHLGAPALGLEGSAIASVIVSLAMMAAYVVILTRDARLRRYRLFGHWWRGHGGMLWRIVCLGAPIALSWVAEGGLFGGAAVLMGLIGVVEVAAHGIALNIAAIAFQLPFGIAQAATIRVGFAYGAGDAAWIGRAGRTALTMGIGVMAATAFVMWAIPARLVALYLDADADPAVGQLAIRFLGVAALFQLVDGAQAVAAGILRGVQDTRVPMLIAIFGYWAIGFGTAAWLGFRTPLGGVGIWWGLAAGLAAVSVLLGWRWAARERLGLVRPRIIEN